MTEVSSRPCITRIPQEPPGFCFLSNRFNLQGADVAVYRGDPDFDGGILKRIERITAPEWIGTFADPVMAPGGAQVICSLTLGSMLYFDVRSVDVETGQLVTLTDSSTRNNDRPVITLEGRIIYYSMVRNTGENQLRVMNPDGTGDELFIILPGTIDSLGISPDGGRLVLGDCR